jgi:Endonuclease/Exonuclease/phosphatase family
MRYKMSMLECAGARMAQLRRQGRHVVIAGDFNISPEPIDHCDPSPDFFLHRPDRRWMRTLLCPAPAAKPACGSASSVTAGMQRDSGAKDAAGTESLGSFVDTFRVRHRGRRGAYTCWNTASGARNNNWGTRIDLILVADPCYTLDCDRSAPEHPLCSPAQADAEAARGAVADGYACAAPCKWSWHKATMAADISADVRGSDHAPAWLDVDESQLHHCGAPAPAAPLLQSSSSLLWSCGQQKQLKQMWALRRVETADSGALPRPAACVDKQVCLPRGDLMCARVSCAASRNHMQASCQGGKQVIFQMSLPT